MNWTRQHGALSLFINFQHPDQASSLTYSALLLDPVREAQGPADLLAVHGNE